MTKFRKALKEIYDTQNKVIILTTFLESLVLFLLVFSVLILINFYRNMAFLIALGYFAYKLYLRVNHKKLTEVERRNPFLKEMLTTAADNMDHENFLVLKLQERVFKGIKEVRLSSFINTKKLLRVFSVLCILALFNVMIGIYGWQLVDLEGLLADRGISFSLKDNLLKHQLPDSFLDADISVEDVNDNTQIQELATLKRVKRQEALPDDLFKASDKTYEELLSKKKRIYIRNYFSQVRDIE